MRAYIKKLQAKPEPERRKILFGSMATSVAFVLVVWILSLGYRFGAEGKIAKTDAVDKEIKPFALFAQSISDTYKNVTASVGDSVSNVKKEKENLDVESDSVELSGKQINLIPVESAE